MARYMKYIWQGRALLLFTMVIGILFTTMDVDAQNFITNHRKYWFFKSRLNNDFTKVGTGDGESLIFNERGAYEDNVSSSFSNPVDGMKIGDGTSTLGYYIAQLALEYYLLYRNHQKTDSTLYELVCALYAINRLDLKAETTLKNPSCSPQLNGFFVRDDVPCNFIQNNYEHFNYFSAGINNNSQSRGFASYFESGMSRTSSDWCDDYEKGGSGLFYISQDQVYNLLYGLAFVRRFVPEGVVAKDRYGNTFWFQDGQIYLSEEAKAIAKRIIDNIRDPKKCTGVSCGGDDWSIRFPNNCDKVPSSGFIDPHAFPLGESECVIDHKKWGASFSRDIICASKCLNGFCSAQYHNTFSLTGGRTLWNNYLNIGILQGIIATGDINKRVMKGNLLAVCNCHYELSNLSPYSISLNAAVGNYYWYMFHQPLGRYLLHGGDLIISNDGGGSHPERNIPVFLLNEMNPCNHFNLGINTNYSSLGWSSDTRLDHPDRIGNCTFRGEYPAIDYMLYFNLWTTKTLYDNPGGVVPDYFNLSHYYINKSTDWIYAPGYYHPSSVPKTATSYYKTQIDAYETIYMEKTTLPYYTNENYFRAGKEIILKATSTPGDGGETYIRPGVETHTVSDGTASGYDDAGIRFYIKKYDCATDKGNFNPYVDASYSFRIADSIQQGNKVVNSSAIHDTIVHFVRPHYVTYPEYYEPNLINDEILFQESFTNDLNFSKIKILPNPSENEVFIYVPESIVYDRIELVDITGAIIDQKNVKNGALPVFYLHNLSSGVYFVNVYNNGQKLYTEKIIKQ